MKQLPGASPSGTQWPLNTTC